MSLCAFTECLDADGYNPLSQEITKDFHCAAS